MPVQAGRGQCVLLELVERLMEVPLEGVMAAVLVPAAPHVGVTARVRRALVVHMQTSAHVRARDGHGTAVVVGVDELRMR